MSTGPDPASREAVVNRDAHMCQRCRKARGAQVHHRCPRRMGGTSDPTINNPSNLILLCLLCHDAVEQDRALSRNTGWLLSTPVDAPWVPLKRPDGSVFWLDNAHQSGVLSEYEQAFYERFGTLPGRDGSG